MNPATMEVNLGGLALRVPVYGSKEQTQEIVSEINNRLKTLESNSTKINTQAFALIAAYEYAKGIRELKEELAERESRLAERVSGMASRIESLARTIEEAV